MSLFKKANANEKILLELTPSLFANSPSKETPLNKRPKLVLYKIQKKMLVIKTAIKNKNNWSILINRSIKKKESGRNDGKDAVLCNRL